MGNLKKVLISGMGTSDPVRTGHDGPVMHIMRMYRPDVIYLYITSEIRHLDDSDHRIEKMMQFIRENWEGYQFSYKLILSEIQNPSDQDLVAEDLKNHLENILNEHESDEILLNLSSGTPQMKSYLSVLSLDTRFNFHGIQVANPTRKSGDSERTNKSDYSVDEELICNQDEEEGCQNRTAEPQYLFYRRQQQRDITKGLLQTYDYSAIQKMSGLVPKLQLMLAKHLQNRMDFDYAAALKCGLAFQKVSENSSVNLYLGMLPGNSQSKVRNQDFHVLSEYFLVLSTLQRAGKYNEFVLRLNPFFVNLELACWKKQSREKGQHYQFSDLFDRSGKLSSRQLETMDPDLYRYVTNRVGILKDGYLSLYVLFYVMEYYNLPENWQALFQAVFDLNENRNHVAHRLVSTTDEEIRQFSGWNARGIVMKTAEVMGELFAPEYKAELGGDPRKSYFSLYENCNNLLRE